MEKTKPVPIHEHITAKPVKLKKILWTTDFSPASQGSLPHAVALARRYESRVYLAHVMVPHPYPMVSPEAVPYVEDLRRGSSKRLVALAESDELRGVPHEVLLGHGEVAEEVNSMIRDHQIDLLVLATHGRRGLRRFLLGSVAEEIWRTVECPVLTVGPHALDRPAEEIAPRQILYPTDLSADAFAAAPFALSFALEYESHLTVLHVVPAAIQTSARLLARAFRDELQEIFPSETAAWCEPECIVESGEPAGTILRIAKERKADLIVLGVRSPEALARQHISNVAYPVVAGADCPVLTVRATT
ncbi:MAG: universal stress protein [Acidobacteria bacterium]|nr:MAG: universal stress protein [Acidobacteriota bacterium]